MLSATQGNLRLKIEQDTDAEDPRKYDHFGVMYCWHRRYILGDVQPSEAPNDWVNEHQKHFDAVILPLYLLDHSGITMSVTPFSCSWDSGQVGWIVGCKNDPARLKEYGLLGATDEKIRKRLQSEVEEYDQYLTGDVYYWAAEKRCAACGAWEHVDSCGGFYGTDWERNGLVDMLPQEYVALVKELE